MKDKFQTTAGILMVLLGLSCLIQAIVHPSELAIFILCLAIFICVLGIVGGRR